MKKIQNVAKIHDRSSLIGELSIKKKENGEKKLIYKEENLITKASKAFLLSGLYTSGVVSDPINSLAVGTAGTIDPEGFYAKVEDPLQTDLINKVLVIPVTTSIDSSAVAVTFLAEVDQTQLNGQLISEAGLFKASGGIFNVKNHPAIPKSSSFSIHYEWRISIP